MIRGYKHVPLRRVEIFKGAVGGGGGRVLWADREYGTEEEGGSEREKWC